MSDLKALLNTYSEEPRSLWISANPHAKPAMIAIAYSRLIVNKHPLPVEAEAYLDEVYRCTKVGRPLAAPLRVAPPGISPQGMFGTPDRVGEFQLAAHGILWITNPLTMNGFVIKKLGQAMTNPKAEHMPIAIVVEAPRCVCQDPSCYCRTSPGLQQTVREFDALSRRVKAALGVRFATVDVPNELPPHEALALKAIE